MNPEYRVERNTVVYQVMNKIKELIASGKFMVNERIPTETELTQMFGTGRSTIREAIKIFNYLGVLESIPSKGTFVCDRSKISSEALTWSVLLGKDELDELLELREIMEQRGLVRLLGLVAENREAAAPHLMKLQHQVDNLRRAINGPSQDDLISANYEFHKRIVELTGNRLFISFYDTLKSYMFNIILKNISKSEQERILKEHIDILEAVKSGDAALTLEKHSRHIRTIGSNLSEKFNRLANLQL